MNSNCNQEQKKPLGSPSVSCAPMNKGTPARTEKGHPVAQNNPSALSSTGVSLAMSNVANNNMTGSDQQIGATIGQKSATAQQVLMTQTSSSS